MHDPMLMRTLVKHDVETLVSTLSQAFMWKYTAQGFDYWDEVYGNLKGILDFADEQLKANQEQEDANS